MFRTSIPVTATSFHDRHAEVQRLSAIIRRLREGAPTWLALIGPRKVGKTSLLLEVARLEQSDDLRFVVLDALDSQPLSLEFFRLSAARVLDVVLGAEIGLSLELMLHDPGGFRGALQQSDSFLRLRPADRSAILELPARPADDALLRFALDLPERLATALDLYLVIAIDEFQELASLTATRAAADPFPIMRSTWQRHRRTTYVVSGSARTMLTELVTSERSPFFQHFALADIGPFDVDQAIELLVQESPAERRIDGGLARLAVAAIGGHPFYLQMLGEAMTAGEPPYTERTLKESLQELLFSRTGRLGLYFENELARLVGRSSLLAAMLEALCEGPRRIGEVATAIGQGSGATVRYAERLGDAVRRRDDGRYELTDPTFATWIRWRRPGGSIVPMTLLGDEGERAVAEHLARMGFELIYQSRASRGAFDLLAIRGAEQLGVQVKRSPLPLRFSREQWTRMGADAVRFGWRWVVAAVEERGDVVILDPARARAGREVRVTDEATIANLLAWMAAGPARPKRRGRQPG